MRNRRAHDAADNRTAENGEAVAAVVDVYGRRRRGRNPVTVTVVVLRWCAMMDGGAFRPASMMGSGHCRAAEGHTRESRDCHCLDCRVHVTPTFPGFCPYTK